MTPIYNATTTILVNQTTEPGVVQYNDVLTSERLTNTYAQLVKRRVVLQSAVDKLNLDMSPEALEGKVGVSAVRDTQLLRISVEDASPEQSALLANTVAQAFIQDNDSQLGRPGTVSITDEATVPSSPSKPNVKLNTVLGLVLGAMLAGGVVLVLEYLDDTVKSSEDVEQVAGLPTLGIVARFASGDIRQSSNTGPTAEAYRQVRTNVRFAKLSQEVRTIVVTSANPAEGKSTTAANLAMVMAQAGEKVILVDTDLRRPSLHTLFGQQNSFGLTGLLLGDELMLSQGLINPGIRNLRLLPSGPLPPNPSELLSAKRMENLIKGLRDAADYVIFDSPPILAVTDASILASLTDAAVVVMEMGKDRPDVLQSVKTALDQAQARVLGVVINKAKRSQRDYYYYRRYGKVEESQAGDSGGDGGAPGTMRETTGNIKA
jgi:capsular exopolysaccharide synthesis family protein